MRNLIIALSLSASASACTWSKPACNDGDCAEDTDTPADGTDGRPGEDGTDGTDADPCTVVDNHNGTYTMECPDGTEVTWSDGDDGGTPATPYCGDGILQAGEECDDNNLQAGDGCSYCTIDTEPPPAGTIWYRDSDNDRYGDMYNTVTAPTQPPGYVANAEDCQDRDGNDLRWTPPSAQHPQGTLCVTDETGALWCAWRSRDSFEGWGSYTSQELSQLGALWTHNVAAYACATQRVGYETNDMVDLTGVCPNAERYGVSPLIVTYSWTDGCDAAFPWTIRP